MDCVVQMSDWFEAGYLWQKSLLVGHEGWETFSQLQAITSSVASTATVSSPSVEKQGEDVAPRITPLAAAQGASSLVYIDDDGKIQGPFSTGTVKSWTEAGMLPERLRVRAADWTDKYDESASGDQSDGWVAIEAVFGVKEEEFEYVDDDGEVQGPFSRTNLQTWIDAGYFSPSTRVRPIGGSWLTMDQLFPSESVAE